MSLKRSTSVSQYYDRPSKKTKAVVKSRRTPIYKNLKGHAFITRSVTYNHTFAAATAAFQFGFSPSALWVNGGTATAISGASDLSILFELLRVRKVAMTVILSNDSMDYSFNNAVTAVKSLPVMWHAPKYINFDSTPTQATIEQAQGVKIDRLDNIVRRTFYPKLANASTSGIVADDSRNEWVTKNFDYPSNGCQVFIDSYTANPYMRVSFHFLITYECKQCM